MTLPTHRAWLKSLFYFLAFATAGLGFVTSALWASLISAAAIVGCGIGLAGRQWPTALGLHPSRSNLAWFVASVVFAVVCVLILVWTLTDAKSVLVVRLGEGFGLLACGVLLQSFSEEVLFRTFLIREVLLKKFKSRWIIVLFSGVFFSVSHWINYRVSESVNLSITTLLSLFLLGCAGCVLFLRDRHIMRTWGFHFGWNVVRFSFVYEQAGSPLRESATFDALEGSLPGVGLSVLILAAVFYPPEAAKAILYAQTQKNEPVSPSEISPPRK